MEFFKKENLMRKIDLLRKNGHSSTLLLCFHQVRSRFALFVTSRLCRRRPAGALYK